MSTLRKVVLSSLSAIVIASSVAIGVSTASVISGTAIGAGWRVVVPDTASVTLTAESRATVPTGCDPAPAPCEAHQTASFANAVVGNPLAPIASANMLRSEAHAYRDAAATATLQSEMNQYSGVALPTAWNLRGYARAEGVSLLKGAILVDSVESESVAGTRTNAAGETV
ncbi:MAG: hypothetical protein M3161_03070, partial [Actinomycetota bacterium]|nr:hypothetical protein [Actinomycetota bacterium]